MRSFLMIAATGLMLTNTPALAGASEVCVTNGGGEDFFFVAEASGGDRLVKWLAVGETLCSTASEGMGGVVSVFVSDENLEGCSRLVSGAQTETLLEYADFDRCRWSSNDS